MSGLKVGAECRSTLTVKIVTMGRGVTNYVAADSMTLGRLLEELGITDRMDVRVNGAAVEKTYRLADADEVLILPRIRAGAR